MTREPYASAPRVYWIVDNGSSHRGQRSVERLQSQWPSLRLVHIPVHASWVNQIEIYFSIAQRKVLTPNDFDHVDQVRERRAGFERLYNQIAEPFAWNFTREKLNAWLTASTPTKPSQPHWPPDRTELPTTSTKPARPRRRGCHAWD